MANEEADNPNILLLSLNNSNFEDFINKKILSLHDKVNNLFDSAQFGSITTSDNYICIGINKTCLDWLGIENDEVLGKAAFRSWVTPQSWLRIQDQKGYLQSNRFSEIEIVILNKKGDPRPIALSCNRYFDTKYDKSIIRWVLSDTSNKNRAFESLNLLSLIFESRLATCIADSSGKILLCNKQIIELTGYDKSELNNHIGISISNSNYQKNLYDKIKDAVERKGYWEGEIRDKAKDGRLIIAWIIISVVFNPTNSSNYYVASLYDIKEKIKIFDEMGILARTDLLTKLSNRGEYYLRLTRENAVGVRSKLFGALLYLDLDNFKLINDTRGHGAGDKLLIEVANRLTKAVRSADLVCRMGGDEFIILLTDLNADLSLAAYQARKSAEKILQTMEAPYQVDDFEYLCTSSIGVAMFGSDEDPDELLKHADLAMYNAKKSGKNRVYFYDNQMQIDTVNQVIMDQDLRRGLLRQQFNLYFQPQVNSNAQIISAEALLRWCHPTQGLVEAESFIPLTEDNGLIIPLGQWVIENACMHLKAWEKIPQLCKIRMAVNISGRQFLEKEFAENVIRVIRDSQIDPSLLLFELTESVVHDLENSLNIMEKVRELGVKFSLDDFGAGYSSLGVLIELPISQLKIDKRFVKNVEKEKSALVVIKTIIAMAGALNIEVVAEGIETFNQFQVLKSLGCQGFQGYYFGKAHPPGAFRDLIH